MQNSQLNYSSQNRIFFPASHDLTSPTPLPTLITIHGGGFCLGSPRDADEWNRAFADTHSTLVISLTYSKAPTSPFPAAIHDLEALYAAILADESLPVARSGTTSGGGDGVSRIAVLGFSAGGNLALALSQLPSVRHSLDAPRAVVSVYGCTDLSIPPERKAGSRRYKTRLPRPKGDSWDMLAGLAPVFDWSYLPYGQDLRDPLLSPAYASEAHLPPYVCIIGAELDMLSHESWRLAVRLGNERFGRGRPLPDIDSPDPELAVSGRKGPSRRRGALEDEEGGDERFGWEDNDDEGGKGVKWMLIPDVIHGFDCPSLRHLMGGEEAIKDAEGKTRGEIEAVGRWLRRKVWKV